MFFTDTADRNSHPFVAKCYEMSLAELKAYVEKLMDKMNELYDSADSGQALTEAEEAEERANIADEVLCLRNEREITD